MIPAHVIKENEVLLIMASQILNNSSIYNIIASEASHLASVLNGQVYRFIYIYIFHAVCPSINALHKCFYVYLNIHLL